MATVTLPQTTFSVLTSTPSKMAKKIGGIASVWIIGDNEGSEKGSEREGFGFSCERWL
jgi:hypothetical protein